LATNTINVSMQSGESLSEVVVLGTENSYKSKSYRSQTVTAKVLEGRLTWMYCNRCKGQLAGANIALSFQVSLVVIKLTSVLQGFFIKMRVLSPVCYRWGTLTQAVFRNLNDIESVSVLKDASRRLSIVQRYKALL
jgi:hypothetical protein